MARETDSIRLVVGLGNPGVRYAGTRHNLGFDVVTQFAAEEGWSWRAESRWECELAGSPELLLLKPMTYMNLSGLAVRPVADFFKIPPSQILVILDDLALPVGRLRLRKGGSDGGHNGLASILQSLGTEKIPRLRVGIGAPTFGDASHFVLQAPPAEETPVLQKAVVAASEAIRTIRNKGLETAMNTINTKRLP